MSPTKYSVRTTLNVITIICLIFIAKAVVYNLNPMVYNDLAMTQMENSDTLYAMMGIYDSVRPIISIVFTIIITGFLALICRDTYKFAMYMNEEINNNNTATDEKEN